MDEDEGHIWSVMKAGARAEWHPLRHVMVHTPGIEVFFALLAPATHLYERFFDRVEAAREHGRLTRMLHTDFGVRVHHLYEELIHHAGQEDTIRESLLAQAESRLERRCKEEICALPRKIQAEMINPVPLSSRDNRHLLDIITLNPILTLAPDGVHTSLGLPLHNLYFMRDQQAATDRGMVAGRMATPERAFEVEVSSLGLRSLDAAPISTIKKGTFEGGDFIPLGETALLGCGSRTNEPGIKQILSEGIGFDEIAVVRDPVHPLIRGHDPMVNMHLDTYFNIPAEGVAVGCPPLLREAQVELYQKASDDYKYKGQAGNLFDYIKNIGVDLIEITTLEQLCYAANFLCIRSGECVAPDTGEIAPLVIRRLAEKELQHPGIYSPLLAQAKKDYSKLSRDSTFFPHNPQVHAHGIAMTTITLTNATGGYGGAHCMTCVVKR